MRNEHGLTLTEILASIVILSIVITTFMLVFVQSAGTTTKSKSILDSTYYAETEMEEIINSYSEQGNTLAELKELIVDKGYDDISKQNGECSICYRKHREDRYITIHVKEANANLGKVILKVYKDEKQKNLEAQMEVVLAFKEEEAND